jgi:hypothetical protein
MPNLSVIRNNAIRMAEIYAVMEAQSRELAQRAHDLCAD